MSQCGPGAIKNLMKIMMIKLHDILGLSEGFHNGAKLAFDPLVIAIHLLVKTEEELSCIHHARRNGARRTSLSVMP